MMKNGITGKEKRVLILAYGGIFVALNAVGALFTLFQLQKSSWWWNGWFWIINAGTSAILTCALPHIGEYIERLILRICAYIKQLIPRIYAYIKRHAPRTCACIERCVAYFKRYATPIFDNIKRLIRDQRSK